MLRLLFWTRILKTPNVARSHINGFLTLRYFSGPGDVSSQMATWIESYRAFIEKQISEAEKSLAFYTQSEDHISKVIKVCRRYGEVKKVFFPKSYSEGDKKKENLVIVEMNDLDSVIRLLGDTTEKPGCMTRIVCRPFIDIDFSQVPRSPTEENIIYRKKISNHTGGRPCEKKYLTVWSVYQNSGLSECDLRVRYMAVVYVSKVLQSFWEEVLILPYGSSVTGFGLSNSDLDLSMVAGNLKNSYLTFKSEENVSNKTKLRNVSYLFHFLTPGLSVDKLILGARYPLVKFSVDFLGVKCDLTVNNEDGFHMSALVSVVGRTHQMLRPLVMVLKKWTDVLNLSKKSSPSSRISNFAIVLLVISFLQVVRVEGHDLIPPVRVLLSSKGTLKDVASFKGLDSDREKWMGPLENCLYRFFKYYSSLDFSRSTVSVFQGKVLDLKMFEEPMGVANPLDESLNVTKAVNNRELLKMQKCCYFGSKLYDEENGFSETLFNIDYYKVAKRIKDSNDASTV